MESKMDHIFIACVAGLIAGLAYWHAKNVGL